MTGRTDIGLPLPSSGTIVGPGDAAARMAREAFMQIENESVTMATLQHQRWRFQNPTLAVFYAWKQAGMIGRRGPAARQAPSAPRQKPRKRGRKKR